MKRSLRAPLIVLSLLRCSTAAPIDDEGLAALVETARVARAIPGTSVAILREGQVLYASGHGLADSAAGRAATNDTKYELGSVGKQFTAAAIMRLVEQRRVGLDDPVSRYLPEVRWESVRVRHLLHQTSGIREFFTIPAFHQLSGDLTRPVEELVQMIVAEPLGFAPGSRWSYSNSNYTLLARIVERVTGLGYEEFLAEEFFLPLGIRSMHHCPSTGRSNDYATGYAPRDGGLVPAEPENFNWARGDGGLCGTAIDLATWLDALATGRVVSEESYREMTARRPAGDGVVPEYGFGLVTIPLDESVARVGHNGAMAGFSAAAATYPEHRVTIVVVTNRGGIAADAIETTLARAVLALASPALAEIPLSVAERVRYSGTFDIGVHDFPVRVTDRNGTLWLEVPRPGPTTALLHAGGGSLVSISEPDGIKVSFSADAMRITMRMGGMHWYGVRAEP